MPPLGLPEQETFHSNLQRAILQAIEMELKREAEAQLEKVKRHLEEKLAGMVAGIAVKLSSHVDFQMLGQRLVITVYDKRQDGK